MKVYIAIRDTKPFELGFLHFYKKGDLLAEKGRNYLSARTYPISKDSVENAPDLFELQLEDNEHNAEYYIEKKYAQYEIDNLLKALK